MEYRVYIQFPSVDYVHQYLDMSMQDFTEKVLNVLSMYGCKPYYEFTTESDAIKQKELLDSILNDYFSMESLKVIIK